MTDDATILSATELSAAIRARRLSCTEVMEAYLDRIGALNPQINAILYLRPRAELIAEARTADAELAAGRYRGWMHGMPHAVKDLAEVSGLPTSWGSRAWRDHRSHVDALHVARIRAAGAIFVGKTNTPEFGLGSHTTNALHGPTRNPWNHAKSAGGSSGGAGAAHGARLVPVADGSDMMGSLRNPAGWNNVYGLRPSAGLVPLGPAPEIFFGQLSTEGPMARNIADLAMLLSTLAGHDPRAPQSLSGDGAEFARPLGHDIAGARIGWLGDLDGYLPTEPGVLETCEAALGILTALGCHVELARIPFRVERLWHIWVTLRGFLVAGSLGALYDNPRDRDLLKPEAIWEIETGRALTGTQIHAASTARSSWYQALLAMFQRYDYLVLPTAQTFPFDADLHWPGNIAGRAMDTYHRWMEVVIGPSLAGVPVLAVPAGFGPEGLPMGLQIIARPRTDRALLELGQAYDLAQDFTARKSPLLS